MPQIEHVCNAIMQVYGADKVWGQINREGTRVARCSVERFGARRYERQFQMPMQPARWIT
jgi:hypothetical protein